MLPTDKVLKEKRKQFVRSVDTGTINGLLDELLEKKVLNQEEMERIRDGHATVMDKARVLIDSVIRKGPEASQIFVSQICEDDCHLAKMLGLSSGKVNNSDSIKFTRPYVFVTISYIFIGYFSLQTTSLHLVSGPHFCVSVSIARLFSSFFPGSLASVAFF